LWALVGFILRLIIMSEKNKVPCHLAIVMDGNGRWAKKRFLPRIAGHKAGKETVRRIVRAARDAGVKVLTLFAFSSENWARPKEEVEHLMALFLRGLQLEVGELHEENIRMRFIGDLKALTPALQKSIAETEKLTRDNSGMQLVIAVNYGGQWDILEACKKILEAAAQGKLKKADLTQEVFPSYLSTQDLPPVDLFIRTSGELRVSNFLLWQCAYAELYFTDVHWPDFDITNFKQALEAFAERKRRFGKSG
jgi:undecaprenyl diphosphate synthase